MVSSFPLKEPAWSSGNISPPKAFQILRYITPSDSPAERVRALVGSRQHDAQSANGSFHILAAQNLLVFLRPLAAVGR
jgi:hypothetical protein